MPVTFNFATGGAGLYLSRALVEIMEVSDFYNISTTIGLPDDVTVGYIVNAKLKVPLTEESRFHSHLEILKKISSDDIDDQITFSYSTYDDREEFNVVNIDSIGDDPTK